MSGTNGKSEWNVTETHTIPDGLEGKSVHCFQLGCDDRIFVKKNSHIKPHEIKCGKGHKMLVWYSHEHKTHIGTSFLFLGWLVSHYLSRP